MIYAVELQLTTPMLGDRHRDHLGVRRFERSKDSNLYIRKETWEDLLKQAQQDLQTQYNLETVNVPTSIRAPSVQLYRRRYNRSKTDHFESIQKGAKLRFDILVRNQPGSKPGPGQEGLLRLLSHIGEWMGISPWGTQYDYGKFTVIHVTPVKDETKPHAFSKSCSSSSALTGT